MKAGFQFFRVYFICIAIFYFLPGASAQNTKINKDSLIKKMVEDQQYVFTAQTASPNSGRLRQLTSLYTVRVSKDSIISDLPYFGRAYSAPTNLSGGGIQFTSTSFDYKVTERKKGGWEVTIKPKDAQDVQQLIMNIFSNGNAFLNVNSNSRQPISFNGSISKKD